MEYAYTFYKDKKEECHVSIKSIGNDYKMFNFPIGHGSTPGEAREDFIRKLVFMEKELIHLCALLHEDEIEDIIEVDCMGNEIRKVDNNYEK